VEEKRKRSLVVRLSAASVTINKLEENDCLRVFVRFLPNRLPFCERHWGVDELKHFPLDAKSVTQLLLTASSPPPAVGEVRSDQFVDSA
jgi:hypothetical protein